MALCAAALGFGQVLAQSPLLRPTDAGADPAPLDGGLRGSDATGDAQTDIAPDPAAVPPDAAAPADTPTPGGGDVVPKPPRRPAGQGSALATPVTAPPPLPPLRPYPSSQRPKGAAIDTVDGATAVGPTVAALPVAAQLRRRPVDDEPFAPVGYTIGSLRLTPYVVESLGYDSNPDQVAGGAKPSAFSRTEGGFSLLSQWSSNELKSVMHAGYDAFFRDGGADRPDAAGTIDYRYDVSRDIALDGEARFSVTTQRPGSPEVNAAVQDRPLVSSYGATVGGSDTFGRLTLGLHGLFDRTEYDNGRLADGTLVRLDTENFNDYGLALRADYQLTPTLKPFGEVTLDTRVHDDRLDVSGYARNSDGITGRLGSAFALTPLVTGTVSLGYEDRSYTDKRLRDLRGPVVEASVAYAVTPLTTLTLLANTSFDETTVAGSPGAESRSVSLQISHALLRNLTLTGTLGYLNTDYVASTIKEDTYSAGLKASYALSRSLIVEATYNHQTLHSTDPTASFAEDVFMLGLRVQH